jgi:hypothetical protein
MGIDLIEGKPSVSGATLAARVNQLAGKRYQIVRHTNDACEIHWYERIEAGDLGLVSRVRHSSDCPDFDHKETSEACDCRPSDQRARERFLGLSRFDEADRERANINLKTSKGYPTNHAKYPRAMKFNRALSAGQKMYASEATLGIPVYTEGELDEPQRFDAGTGALEEPRSLHAIVQDLIPWQLRDRFHAAWGEASRVRKGMLTRAAVEMELDGRTPEEVEQYIGRIELENLAARDASRPPTPETVADIVGEAVVEPEVPIDLAALREPANPEVQRLRVQLAALTATAETLDPVANLDKLGEIDSEFEYVESRIRELEAKS